MNVKKFTAATSREALRKVREALGPDAVILSNRPVDGVVEILALASDDVASVSAPAPDTEMAQPRPSLHDAARACRQPPRRRRAHDPYTPHAVPHGACLRHGRRCRRMMQAAIAHAKDSAAAEMSGMMNEIRAMRGHDGNPAGRNRLGRHRSSASRKRPACCAKCWPPASRPACRAT